VGVADFGDDFERRMQNHLSIKQCWIAWQRYPILDFRFWILDWGMLD
jgi:hypothetical protein